MRSKRTISPLHNRIKVTFLQHKNTDSYTHIHKNTDSTTNTHTQTKLNRLSLSLTHTETLNELSHLLPICWNFFLFLFIEQKCLCGVVVFTLGKFQNNYIRINLKVIRWRRLWSVYYTSPQSFVIMLSYSSLNNCGDFIKFSVVWSFSWVYQRFNH